MALERLELLLPEAQQVYERVHAMSSSSGGSYLVDLNTYTCSCPDFAGRASAPDRSIARACKHIARAIVARSELIDRASELEHAVLRRGGTKNVYFKVVTRAGGVVVAGVDGRSGWADVWFRNYRKGDPLGGPTGAWKCYGLSRDEWRWSYAEGPRGAREIKELLSPLRHVSDSPPRTRGSQRDRVGAGCMLTAVALASLVASGLALASALA